MGVVINFFGSIFSESDVLSQIWNLYLDSREMSPTLVCMRPKVLPEIENRYIPVIVLQTTHTGKVQRFPNRLSSTPQLGLYQNWLRLYIGYIRACLLPSSRDTGDFMRITHLLHMNIFLNIQ
jgi:hypothetical protein